MRGKDAEGRYEQEPETKTHSYTLTKEELIVLVLFCERKHEQTSTCLLSAAVPATQGRPKIITYEKTKIALPAISRKKKWPASKSFPENIPTISGNPI